MATTTAGTARWILHADMDAFYASVEQRDFPELAEQPVVVGGNNNRGVVAAASYQARKFGVRSAMPMREAHRRCPDLVVQPLRMSVYKDVSRDVFRIFRRITPLVEGLSLDEAFLDISASLALLGNPRSIAAGLKARVREQTGLAVSVGAAPNKLVAKIASDLDKPDGLCIVEPDAVVATLAPLSIRVLPGIGPRTGERLTKLGIATLEDLRTASEATLAAVFGKNAVALKRRAAGIDDRDVVPVRREKSLSAERTFDTDLTLAELEPELVRLAETVAARVRDKHWQAATLTIKIRQHDFTTVTRQTPLKPPSAATDAYLQAARVLLHSWFREHPEARIRLLGVGVAALGEARQSDLFATPASADNPGIDDTIDEVTARFGHGALTRARTLDKREDPAAD